MTDHTAPPETTVSYLQHRPHLRPVEAFPVKVDGKELIALRDVSNLAKETPVVTEGALYVMQHFTGEQTVVEIAGNLETEVDSIAALVEYLDCRLFLYGDRYEVARQGILAEFDALPVLPIRAGVEFTAETMTVAFESARASKAYQSWQANGGRSNQPEPQQIHGLVAPHLDLGRGAVNYALSYAVLKDWYEADTKNRFDRVIVFGTNHFGAGTGVVMNAKAQETAVGLVPIDTELAEELTAGLGDALVDERLDHLREHSVELQMPWIRQVLGAVPTLGFLVHDPTVNEGGSYDGTGVGLNEFLTQLRESLEKLGGRTLFVASADLSHIGPDFGDEDPNSSERLSEVEAHDREHLAHLVGGEVELFVRSMTAKRNATRWCTLGGMTALWKILGAESTAHLLNYHQAVKHPDHDDLTHCCVTSAAMILLSST